MKDYFKLIYSTFITEEMSTHIQFLIERGNFFS